MTCLSVIVLHCHFGSASQTPTNPWSLCEAHKGWRDNSCARRSLRYCLKTNWNPSDTAVNCHFSHEFGNSFWYGGLLRIATEHILAMIQLSLPITIIIGLLLSPFSSAGWSCSSDSFNLLLSEYQFTQEIPNKAHKASARTARVKCFLSIATTTLVSSFPPYLHKEL